MNAAKKMTLAEMIAAAAASGSLKPAVGELGYLYYHGRRYDGIITVANEVNGSDGEVRGLLEPVDPKEDWGWHTGSTLFCGHKIRGIFFGYDQQGNYNITEGKWHLVADYD